MRRLGRAIALVGAVLALAGASAPGASANATRAEYAAEANAICNEANSATKRVSRAFLAQAKRTGTGEEIKPKQEARLIRSFSRLNKRIAAIEADEFTRLIPVPAAPGDESLVSVWLTSQNDLRKLNKRVSELLLKLFKVIPLEPPSPEEVEEKLPRKATKIFNRLFNLFGKSAGLMDTNFLLGAQLGVTSCVTKPSEDIFASSAATAAEYALA